LEIFAANLSKAGFSWGCSSEINSQPNMEAALGDLRAARASLQKAVPDKAGHRNQAIALVDQAIAQVQAGMAAAR
jgi:hypothetical protein